MEGKIKLVIADVLTPLSLSSSRSSGASLAAALDLSAAFRAHAAFVFRVLRSLGVEAQALDDGVQEVFMVAMRRWHTYDARGPVRPWLFGIARRVASHQRRQRRRQLRREASAWSRAPVPSLERGQDRRLAVDFVQDFCATLPDHLRDVFVSMQLEDMTAQETAEVLDVNVNTVYTRLRRARFLFGQAVDERFRDIESGSQ